MKIRLSSWQYRLMLLTLLVISPFGVSAYDFSSDGIYYNYKDGNLEVAGAENSIKDVIIPSQVEYEGKKWTVISVGGCAFLGSNIFSIIIPNTVTSIGESAFWGCYDLKSVTLPNSITSIESDTFYQCSALTSISIPNSVDSIGESAFNACRSLEFISIPGSVINIKGSAFYDCIKLKEVIFEDADAEVLIEYGGYSGNQSGTLFNYCPLEKVYLGRKLTTNYDSYEVSPFYGKESLVAVTISDSLSHLGDYTFTNCTGLTTISIPNSVITIGDWAFRGCTGLTNISIPNSVTEIGASAFSGCTGLSSISIPNSVTEIGAFAFSGCTGLSSISIPNSVTTIGNGTFKGCLNLNKLLIEDGIQILSFDTFHPESPEYLILGDCPLNTLYLGRNITFNRWSPFYNIGSIECVTISETVSSIEVNTFYGCTGLKKVIIEDSTEKLSLGKDDTSNYDKGIFADCPLDSVIIGRDLVYTKHPFADIKTLTSVIFSNSVTSIGGFRGCTGLQAISIPNSVITIGESAFRGCTDLQSISIPNSVTTIEHSTFWGCSSLTSVNLSSSITYISPMTFYGCKSLKSISIPESVTGIYSWAFAECDELTSLSIPNSVSLIAQDAFWNCRNINTVRFEDGDNPLSIDLMGDCSSESLFCDSPLESIYLGRNISCRKQSPVEEAAPPFKNMVTLKNITISKSVTEIGNEAFKGCTGLGSVTIPNSIISIGNEAFMGCTGLTTFTIPNSVTSLGENAFNGTNLGTLILEDGNSSLTIGDGTKWDVFKECPLKELYLGRNLIHANSKSPFYNMTSLDSLSISNTVSSINDYAFYGCSGLTSVIIPNSVISIGKSAFGNCSRLTSISIPNTVRSIETVAFSGCTSLKELTIQEGPEILRLGDDSHWGVFRDCPLESLYLGRNLSYSQSPFKNFETLVNVEMSNTITSIGNEAFYGCTGLGSITIPNSVTSIGESAFTGCTGLGSITIPNAVTSIGESAFTGCTGLGSITIPNAVTSIGNAAFKYCSSVSYISFGKLLRTMGEQAFYGCNPETVETFSYNIEGIESSGLSKNVGITLRTDSDFAGIGATNLTYFNRLILKDKNNKEYGLAIAPWNLNFANCLHSENDKYILPLEECHIRYSNDNQYIVFHAQDITKAAASENGFTFIPSPYHSENTFSVYGDADDASLSKTIHLDQAGTLFDKLDLKNIEKIQTLTLSGYINGTDVMTINRMTALKYLDITDAMIVEGGVTYRDNLKTADNVVGERFFNDINLEVLHLPNTAYKIEKYAFAETPLKLVTIPTSVKRMEYCVFSGCPSLTTLTIPGSVTYIGIEAFAGTPLKEVIFEDGTEDLTIDSNCFGRSLWQSIYLQTLYLGRNIQYSSYSPFSLTSLTDITISDSVTAIGAGEFAGTGISYITLPASITTIGQEAFQSCYQLESAVIPQSVTSIGAGAFKSCRLLSSVAVPENLERIEDDVFNGCRALTSFTIPETVTSIGKSAFEYCSSLTSIQIPRSVLTIGDNAFKGCSSLAEANIPERITSIGDYAFHNTVITEVVLPESVQKVGDYAFGGNTGIRKVVSLNSIPPEIYTNTFDSEVKASIPLHVCKGALVYYWLDPIWKEFSNMSDDVLCLQTIPDARYGDEEIDLSQYAPEGVALTYKSSNEDVVKINGTTMQIVGAGEATVAAILDEEGTIAELVGQMRRIFVDQADLIVTIEDIIIEEGTTVPDFTYLTEGLQYDDTLDDIEKLPVPLYDVDETSPVGEYEVRFTDGYDRNYKIATRPAKITVTIYSQAEDITANPTGTEIEVYDLDGRFVFRGERADAHLSKGIYIIRQGNVVRKVTVR